MKERRNIRKYFSVFSLLGLALLLLLSPCKLRGFFHAEFDIPQTQVLNKSQTTLSTANCVSIVVDQTQHASTKWVAKAFDNFAKEKVVTFSVPSQVTITSSIGKPKQLRVLPLYILYQNIQVYS